MLSIKQDYQNIADIYNNKSVLFDGSTMIDQIINNIQTSNILDTFVGMLHLSSKRVYTTGKSGIIRKEFTSFFKCLSTILVKTKKTTSSPDICAIVKVDYIENNIIYCNVLEYIGEIDDPSIDMFLLKSLSTCHWNKKLDKSCNLLYDLDLTPERTNLTSIEIYSIDPIGCEDIDDALHCIETDYGYEVGIHIADVSSFITEDNDFDKELSKRIETIYFNYTGLSQINMIPSNLSITHMSLKEGNLKRSFSIILKINQLFEVIDVEFKKSNIIVQQNLSYNECETMIGINITLTNLYNLGINLKNNIIDAFPSYEIYDTHQMVAVYMIYANKYVAEHIVKYTKDTVILRTQNLIHHNKDILSESYLITKDISSELLKKYNLSNYERAYYKIGSTESYHMGMNLEYYTHFTSPIRRYVDILVHRQLWKTLIGETVRIPNSNIIYSINIYSRLYKQIQRYSHLLEVIKNINNDIIDIFASIISIRNNTNSIRIYIPDYDMECDIILFNKKLKHLVETIHDDDTLSIKNCITEKDIIFQLFQKIKIRIAITRKSLEKINISIIEPNLLFFLSENLSY